MKHIADRGYTDVQLNKHVDKDAVLEEEYKKAGVELTEERIKYLVEERKLYIAVEEIKESEVKEITPVDDIPEGAEVLDRVDIVEDNKEEEQPVEEESNEEETEKDNKEEEQPVEEEKETKNNNTKSTKKNTTKKEEK